MAFINWSSRYSVGSAEFDYHHQVLVNLINELHEAMRGGKGSQVLGDILAQLADYTVFHFSAEESAMQARAYPEAAGHEQAHEAFVQQVQDFQARFQASRLGLSIEVMNFLKDWLINHIQNDDLRMAAFLNKRP
jgi:hemerythrin